MRKKRKREISGQNNTYYCVHIGTMVFMRMVWLVRWMYAANLVKLYELIQKNYLYTGVVGHRRFTPFNHFFKYPLFMAYIDLNTVNSFLKKSWFLECK